MTCNSRIPANKSAVLSPFRARFLSMNNLTEKTSSRKDSCFSHNTFGGKRNSQLHLSSPLSLPVVSRTAMKRDGARRQQSRNSLQRNGRLTGLSKSPIVAYRVRRRHSMILKRSATSFKEVSNDTKATLRSTQPPLQRNESSRRPRFFCGLLSLFRPLLLTTGYEDIEPDNGYFGARPYITCCPR